MGAWRNLGPGSVNPPNHVQNLQGRRAHGTMRHHSFAELRGDRRQHLELGICLTRRPKPARSKPGGVSCASLAGGSSASTESPRGEAAAAGRTYVCIEWGGTSTPEAPRPRVASYNVKRSAWAEGTRARTYSGTYVRRYLLAYLLSCLFTYSPTYLLTHILTHVGTCACACVLRA